MYWFHLASGCYVSYNSDCRQSKWPHSPALYLGASANVSKKLVKTSFFFKLLFKTVSFIHVLETYGITLAYLVSQLAILVCQLG